MASSETIYLTAADSAGNMVSFIKGLYDEFGSGIVVPGTGFALHDRSDRRWGSQAIIRLERGYAAGSDPRKDGAAVGW